jgi:hypothetical protein
VTTTKQVKLARLVDQAQSRSDAPDPAAVVDEVIMRLPVEQQQYALREALRIYCYVRHYERQEGLTLPGVSTDA